MKTFMPLLFIASSLILTSCNGGSGAGGSSSSAGTSVAYESLSAEDNATLDLEIQTMFKYAVGTSVQTEKNGCQLTSVVEMTSLRDNSTESISYQKQRSFSATKACGDITINSETKVIVGSADTCERKYKRSGNLVEMNSCGMITTIDLKARRATATSNEDGSTYSLTITADPSIKSRVAQELKNVTIVYTKSDAEGNEIESHRTVGNAFEILNLSL